MIFLIVITLLFLFLTIYFYFRVEKLQREIGKVKSENKNHQKENKALLESLILVASRQEEFAKNRFQLIQSAVDSESTFYEELRILSPFINNYAAIFRACLKGKGQLSVFTKKCYDSGDPESYSQFSALMAKQDSKIKRIWGSNTLNGYLTLVETLLVKYENSINKEDEEKEIAKAS
jgi:hypothetical protein